MNRVIAIGFLTATALLTSECQAQRFRLFNRSDHTTNQRRPQAHVSHQRAENRPARPCFSSSERFTKTHSGYNNYTNPASPFPKYIGGFHSSHFYNLGVPNGDIGFRGNGIYWAPW